jgi:hypothetical protein
LCGLLDELGTFARVDSPVYLALHDERAHIATHRDEVA